MTRISNFAEYADDPIKGRQPDILWGTVAPDGDANSPVEWADATLGTLYVRSATSNTRLYVKTANNAADADWVVAASTDSNRGFIPIPLTSLVSVSSNNLVSRVGTNKRVGRIAIPLSSWREVVSNDIPDRALTEGTPNTGNFGGLLATDTTPAYEFVNGDTDSEHRLRWAASNSDPITTQVHLPSDLDHTQDLTLYIRGESAGTTDVTTTFTVETFFDEGDTKVSDTSAAMAAAVGNRATTIAAADYPASTTVSIELTLGTHTTDAIDVYDTWLEYYVLEAPYLQVANGDTDAVATLTWIASGVEQVWASVPLPPDFNGALDAEVHFRGKMSGATDTPTVTVDTWWDEGDTKVSDTSSALGSSYAEETATIAAADIPDAPQVFSLKLTPGAHTTDSLLVSALWLEYARL